MRFVLAFFIGLCLGAFISSAYTQEQQRSVDDEARTEAQVIQMRSLDDLVEWKDRNTIVLKYSIGVPGISFSKGSIITIGD